MTALNYWHFILLLIILSIFALGVWYALKQPVKKLTTPMIISVALICSLLTGFSIVVIDKYTKVVKLYKLKNKRLLSTEQIIYTGIVKNEGNHRIGEVTLEIKIVNEGSASGKISSGSFYEPSGFFDFFSGGADILYKPQKVVKRFVVAKNLKPGHAKSFSVHFKYPPYFKNVSQFAEVSGH